MFRAHLNLPKIQLNASRCKSVRKPQKIV